MGDVAFLDVKRLHSQPPPELFAISEDLYERYRGVGTVYSAQVDYLAQRDEITTMQPERGARYDRGSDHVEVLSVGRGILGGFTILLSESTHRLRGDNWKAIRYLLINSSRREALSGRAGFFSRSLSSPPLSSFIFPMLEVRKSELEFRPSSESPPLDPAWIDGAELIRVETRDLGWFSKSIQLKDLVMERIARPFPKSSQTGKDG